MSTRLAEAAAFIAQTWPCFPCGSDKRPITARGFYDAVRDPDEARRLFRQPGAVLIGVPTGAMSGVCVVDLDVKNGGRGLEWLAANDHRLPRTRRHRTRTGGLHLVFAHPAGRRIRNSASRIAPGVDIRGDGGFVIVPPSAEYSIEDDAMPAPMPAWLLDLIDPPQPAPLPRPAPMPRTAGDGTPYGLAGLDRECAAIAGAADGAKHDALNKGAFSIGGLVAAGEIAEGPAFAALSNALDAIRHRCEDQRAAERTLRQAFEAGMAQPRQAPPPRSITHTVRYDYGPPPDMPEPPPHDVVPESVAGEPDDAPPEGEWIDPETGEVHTEKPRLKPPGPGLPLVYFEDAKPNLDAADFIEGLLIERAMSVVYGPSNCGKTFFVTDLALHVAAGWHWRGREVERGGVIYCALEGSHGILNRVAAFRQEHQITDAIPFAVIPVTLNMLDPSADTDRVIAAIREAAERMGVPVVWVIMDTLSRAIAGGNENSPEDMGALVTNGTRIQQEAGCHLTWIHHSGKDQAQGARGHSLLRAATDTEIEISRQDTESPSVARVTKQREMEIDGEFVFSLRAVELGTNRRGKPVTSCVVEVVEGEAPTRKRGLSQGAQEGLKALQEALAKHGQSVRNRDIPENVPVVHGDLWRQEFFARSTRDTDEATRKAFYRSIKDLMGAGRVGYLHKMAWIVRAEDA